MHEIKRVIRQAAIRLALVSYLRHAVYLLAAALSLAIAALLVERLWPLEQPLPWLTIAYWSLGAIAAGALGWTIAARHSERAVARHVDEAADLRESLSTALCVANTDDPWARATVESAVQRARGVNIRLAVPIQPPKFWPVPLALALTLLVISFVPPRQTSQTIAKAEEKARIVAASTQAEKAKEIEAKVAELLDQKPESAAADDQALKAPEAKTPEEITLQAIKKLTSTLDRLEELKQGEEGKTAQTVNQMLKELKQPGPGPLSEMSKELAKGNFAKAAEQLAEQMKKAQMGEMSEADKKKLAEQLEKMSDQLKQLADAQQKAAEKELEKAGLNKELAKDPQKLAEALKNATNLTEEQKKQIQSQCNACKNAGESGSKMSQCMGQMAASMMQNGQMDPNAMNALQQLAQEMGDLDKLANRMGQCDSAMADAKAQMEALAKFCDSQCNGMGECSGDGSGKIGSWKSGWSEAQGNGSGGPGRGQGSRRDEAKADFAMKIEKQKTKTQAGPIIASEILDADEQQVGESTQTASNVAALAEQNYTEAMESNNIPREHFDVVKHYFGKLKAKTKASASENSPPAEKSSGSKDSGDGK
ncbi:MAG: hypothetical protein AB7G11_09600 [Phycisphaerales bacterium]